MRRRARGLGIFVLVLVTLLLLLARGGAWRERARERESAQEGAQAVVEARTTRSVVSHEAPRREGEGETARDEERTRRLVAERARYADASLGEASLVTLGTTDPSVPSASVTGGEALSPAIENTCSVDLELFWVDYEGHERSYGLLEAGVESVLSTFRGHVWRARDLAGNEVRAFSATDATVALCDDTHLPSRSAPITRAPTPTSPDASPRSIQRASLTITNRCDEPLALTWVHFDGTERPYGVLAPGDVREQATFEGHLFRARREDGTLVASVVASGDSRVGLCGDGTAPDA